MASPAKHRKYRLRRISPASLAFLLGTFGFCVSFVGILLVTVAMRPGVTGNLTGFVSFQFKDRVEIPILVIYPFANAIGGIITGFVSAWLYNFWAKAAGGLQVELSQDGDTI